MLVEEATISLTQMFEQVASTFLKASDNTANREEKLSTRSAFMNAISLLEDSQAQITTLFRQQLGQGFQDFITDSTTSRKEKALGSAIVGHIQVRKIAFEGRNRYFKQLYELRQRMALVQGGQKIEEQQLPGGPTHLIGSFCASIKALDIAPQAQTLLYSLFDQHVLGNMEATYDRYNALLIEAGLFPHLRPITARPPGSETPDDYDQGALPASPHLEAAGTPEAPQETAKDGDALLDNTPDKPDDEEIPHAATIDMLITALNQIQPLTSLSIDALNSNAGSASSSLESDQQLIDDLHKSLNRERKELFDAIGQNRIPKPQLHTIKLMEMLFEEVANTPLLLDVSKALICSLHIPFLKAALMDEGFFSQREHPARQLLNLMVSSGGQLVNEQNLQHGIYPQLSNIADKIIFEFTDNTQVFEALYEKLHDAVQELEQKAYILEQRAQETARGRDKLKNAHLTVATAIDAHTHGHTLPRPISQFLNGTWRDKLTLMLLRNPEATDTPEWQEALAIVDDLSELTTNPQSDSQQQDLKKRIQEGISLLGDYQGMDIENLYHYLSGEEPSGEERHQETTEAVNDPLGAQDNTDTIWPNLSEQELSSNERVVLEKLLKVEPGTWFELSLNKNQRRRCKFSWRSDLTSKHVFIGCCGALATIIPATALARELYTGRARILGHYSIPFVDRALQAMGNRMRQ